MRKKTYVILAVFILSSCSQMTKEKYLSEYESFIQQVKDNQTIYTEKNWQRQDRVFYKFSTVLYKRFENEYTLVDNYLLTKYSTQYIIYRYKGDAKKLYDVIREDLNDAKDAIENYF
jgi:uncharacterized protein YjcR